MRRQLILIFILTVLFPQLVEAEKIYFNPGRGYQPFAYATQEGIIIDNPTDTLRYDYYKLSNPTPTFNLTFRGKNLNGNPAKKYQYYTSKRKSMSIKNPHWGVFVTCEKDTFVVTVKGGEKMTALEPVPCLEVTLYSLKTKRSESVSLTDKFNPYDGDNLWKIDVNDKNLTISGGNRDFYEILDYPCNSSVTGFGFFAGWGDKVLLSDISVEYKDESVDNSASGVNKFELTAHQSEDPMEGNWALFDRELEESLLKLGGFYNLKCIKEGDIYKFYYLDGANINGSNWHAGDLKAILSPTSFEGIYDVEWIDAMKEPMNYDIKAQKGEGDVLLIQFPYQSSKLRLRKISG